MYRQKFCLLQCYISQIQRINAFCFSIFSKMTTVTTSKFVIAITILSWQWYLGLSGSCISYWLIYGDHNLALIVKILLGRPENVLRTWGLYPIILVLTYSFWYSKFRRKKFSMTYFFYRSPWRIYETQSLTILFLITND